MASSRTHQWWPSHEHAGTWLVNPRDLAEPCYYAVVDDFGDLVEVVS